MGMDTPKQFIRLQDGRTVLETCVAAFQQNEHIGEIAIVMLPEFRAEAQRLLPTERFTKVRYWVDGGAERWESSLHAIETINSSINQSSINCPIVHGFADRMRLCRIKNCPIVNQNSAFFGVLGNGITSRMFCIPVTNSIRRSKPRPKPACGAAPKRRVSRYHHMSFIGM